MERPFLPLAAAWSRAPLSAGMLDPLKLPELLTPAEMGEADRLAIAGGTPGIALMERAGLAVADEAARLARVARTHRRDLRSRQQRRRRLRRGAGSSAQRGYPVELGLLGRREALAGDAAIAASRFDGRSRAAAADVALDGAACVIDALFGAGLARDIEGEARTIVERINAFAGGGGRGRRRRRALGRSTARPARSAGVAVEATASVTFFRLKPGHLLEPGRSLCGAIRLADIGIPASVLPRDRAENLRQCAGPVA